MNLEDTIKALLPKEKQPYIPSGYDDLYESTKIDGYNQALSEVHAAIPSIIDAVYEDLQRKVREKLNNAWVSGGATEIRNQAFLEVLKLLTTKN